MSAAFWDGRADAYDEGVRKHEGLYAPTLEAALAYLDPTAVVLDLGCASGEIALDLAAGVQLVHGIDTSARMIEIARQKASERGINNASFAQVDMSDSGLREMEFTAVVAFNVLHLIGAMDVALAQIWEVLPAGGLLISQTPCLGSSNFFLRTVIGAASRLGLAPQVTSLTPARLEAACRAQGFELVEAVMWDDKDKIYRIVARKG